MPESNRPLLTINLGAIAENYSRIRAQSTAAACGAAIKADCYGLGLAEVAPKLYLAGCRDFFVATVEEGIAARSALPDGNIYVLFGVAEADRGLFALYNLIPVLNSLPQIVEWLSRVPVEAGRPVALHLDTGMARLGLDQNGVQRLVDDPDQLKRLNISLVMSHLACADEPKNEMNRQQLTAFKAACHHLGNAMTNRPRASFANSSGIYLGPEFHFDLMRPGAALYGLNPAPGRPNPMRQVVQLMAPILQVRPIDAGKCVGYGATHRFSQATRVATIAIGYADGMLRTLGNRGAVHIGEFRAPIVGRVSMDLITIDVGHVPEDFTRPGTMVEIMGPRQDADALGHSAGTIGYEVLTALGRRYRRDYNAE